MLKEEEVKAFEKEVVAVLVKYCIPQAVLLYRNGTTLSMRAFAMNDIDGAGTGALCDKISEDVLTRETAQLVQKAMDDKEKELELFAKVFN